MLVCSSFSLRMQRDYGTLIHIGARFDDADFGDRVFFASHHDPLPRRRKRFCGAKSPTRGCSCVPLFPYECSETTVRLYTSALVSTTQTSETESFSRLTMIHSPRRRKRFCGAKSPTRGCSCVPLFPYECSETTVRLYTSALVSTTQTSETESFSRLTMIHSPRRRKRFCGAKSPTRGCSCVPLFPYECSETTVRLYTSALVSTTQTSETESFSRLTMIHSPRRRKRFCGAKSPTRGCSCVPLFPYECSETTVRLYTSALVSTTQTSETESFSRLTMIHSPAGVNDSVAQKSNARMLVCSSFSLRMQRDYENSHRRSLGPW